MKALPDSTAPAGSWHATARRHPCAFLLAAQLLSLAIYPMLDATDAGRIVFGAIGVLFVLLAVWVVNRSPATNWIAWCMAAPAVVLALAGAFTGNESVLLASAILEALLYAYAAGSLIAYMLGDHKVTRDELFAAGTTFTLLGWSFAYAFLACQIADPGSITGAVQPDRPRTWIELLFLSFTNLSATGLGDVLPLSPYARVIAILEQMCGVGYVAVVVSRLIGLSLQRLPPRA